jgi:hypothetical protein
LLRRDSLLSCAPHIGRLHVASRGFRWHHNPPPEQKNQEIVFIPIPPRLKAAIDQLPLNGGYYFLQSEKHYTQTDAWRTILNDAFKKEVPGFHAIVSGIPPPLIGSRPASRLKRLQRS